MGAILKFWRLSTDDISCGFAARDSSAIKSHSTILQRLHRQISLSYYTIPPAMQASFNVTFYLEYHCTAVSEVSRGKKWSVNPFQTLKVQETEYTNSSANFRNYEEKQKNWVILQNLHACFTLMFRNEHRWNLIFFLAWHVIESHLLKEELSLIFSAKKLICNGEKFVPQTVCLSSEVNK